MMRSMCTCIYNWEDIFEIGIGLGVMGTIFTFMVHIFMRVSSRQG